MRRADAARRTLRKTRPRTTWHPHPRIPHASTRAKTRARDCLFPEKLLALEFGVGAQIATGCGGLCIWVMFTLGFRLALQRKHQPHTILNFGEQSRRKLSYTLCQKRLSMVRIWETFATDGTDRPVPLSGRLTFPGASARRRFEVMTAAITVLMRLSLKLFAEIISTGRRYPGADPAGSGNEAHQISPRRITTCRG